MTVAHEVEAETDGSDFAEHGAPKKQKIPDWLQVILIVLAVGVVIWFLPFGNQPETPEKTPAKKSRPQTPPPETPPTETSPTEPNKNSGTVPKLAPGSPRPAEPPAGIDKEKNSNPTTGGETGTGTSSDKDKDKDRVKPPETPPESPPGTPE
jgi:cytoskeletal protein RodZ